MIPISSEIAWNRAFDHFHDGTTRRTFRENVVAGHYGVATVIAALSWVSLRNGCKRRRRNTLIWRHHEGHLNRVSVYMPAIISQQHFTYEGIRYINVYPKNTINYTEALPRWLSRVQKMVETTNHRLKVHVVYDLLAPSCSWFLSAQKISALLPPSRVRASTNVYTSILILLL